MSELEMTVPGAQGTGWWKTCKRSDLEAGKGVHRTEKLWRKAWFKVEENCFTTILSTKHTEWIKSLDNIKTPQTLLKQFITPWRGVCTQSSSQSKFVPLFMHKTLSWWVGNLWSGSGSSAWFGPGWWTRLSGFPRSMVIPDPLSGSFLASRLLCRVTLLRCSVVPVGTCALYKAFPYFFCKLSNVPGC